MGKSIVQRESKLDFVTAFFNSKSFCMLESRVVLDFEREKRNYLMSKIFEVFDGSEVIYLSGLFCGRK